MRLEAVGARAITIDAAFSPAASWRTPSAPYRAGRSRSNKSRLWHFWRAAGAVSDGSPRRGRAPTKEPLHPRAPALQTRFQERQLRARALERRPAIAERPSIAPLVTTSRSG